MMDTLKADCANCHGLCCIVPAFARSSDFAIDKPARTPCPNLQDDHRCGIHSQLRERGFPGCTVYDCFGAGQHTSQPRFAGHEFDVFPIMRILHELLYHLREARSRAADTRLDRSWDDVQRLALSAPDELRATDVEKLRSQVAVLLREASQRVRGSGGGDHAGAMLLGADLRRAQLRKADLRGAVLVGARLTKADLREADLLGADLRGADLRGADLTEALFLTQAQLDSARGDTKTRLPDGRIRPSHWRTKCA